MTHMPEKHGQEEQEKTEKKGEKGLPNPVEAELFSARIVMISAPVDSRLAHAVCAKLLALERADAEAPVYLFINCPGGEVYSGFSIFDTARFIRPRIITVVTGLAASMGSIISLCAKPEDRYAFPNPKFLVHQPLMSGGLAGSATDIAIHARDLIETKKQDHRSLCQRVRPFGRRHQKSPGSRHLAESRPSKRIWLGLQNYLFTH